MATNSNNNHFELSGERIEKKKRRIRSSINLWTLIHTIFILLISLPFSIVVILQEEEGCFSFFPKLLVGYMYTTSGVHAWLANPRLGARRVIVAFLIRIGVICKQHIGKMSESSSRNL